MKKWVVTWTFMRHIHRQRQYKILTKIIDAPDFTHAYHFMNSDDEVQALYKLKYKPKLKAFTALSTMKTIKTQF